MNPRCDHCHTTSDPDLTEYEDFKFCGDCIDLFHIGECEKCGITINEQGDYFEHGAYVDDEWAEFGNMFLCDDCAEDHLNTECGWCKCVFKKSTENIVVDPDDEPHWCCDDCRYSKLLWDFADDVEVDCDECCDRFQVKDCNQNIGGTFTCSNCLKN